MHYQHTDTRYHLRPYHQNTVDGRMLLPQQPACLYDAELRPASGSSSTNSAVFRNPVHDRPAQRPDGDVLRRVPNDHGRTHAPMTSYRHDVMQRTSDASTVTSPPSPYDCKPPYSYISLIAMAIESSPDRRLVFVYILYPNLYTSQTSSLEDCDVYF